MDRQKLQTTEQKSSGYRQELAQIKKELHKTQQDAIDHRQVCDRQVTVKLSPKALCRI